MESEEQEEAVAGARGGGAMVTHSRRLVFTEHAPGVPAETVAVRGVLRLPESVDVVRGKASGHLDEEIREREARQ